MNWTRSLGECWWVVVKVGSLQLAGTFDGGGHGSGPPQLFSSGEGEHSKVSIIRTAGKPLLMNDEWSLVRPGRSASKVGSMVMEGTAAPPQGTTKRTTPRRGEWLSA